MKRILIIVVANCIVAALFTGCEQSLDGNQVALDSLIVALTPTAESDSSNFSNEMLSNEVPQSRDELSNMRTVVKIFDGETNGGVTVPGFGGIKLGKKEKSLNVYYLETKVVKSGSDTVVYGIGYSVHYLFKKVKKGLNLSNLASVAASAEIESKRTQVYYSLQSYGIKSLNLVRYFKPVVNANFDVDGFAVMQSHIDGIHNVLGDSVLSTRTSFSPELIKIVKPYELQQ